MIHVCIYQRCTKCSRHLAKGKRFNAKKVNDGKYFTTTLYSFEMKCPSCDQEMIIKTDPENRTYNYVSGITKMEHSYEMGVDNNEDVLVVGSTDEEKMKLSNDAIYKLQNDNVNKYKIESINDNINLLIHKNEIKATDYDVNSALRKKMRIDKQHTLNQLKDSKVRHINYPLLPVNESDNQLAYVNKRHSTVIYDRKESMKLMNIMNSSIFNATNTNTCNNNASSTIATTTAASNDRKRLREGFVINTSNTNANTCNNTTNNNTVIRKRKL